MFTRSTSRPLALVLQDKLARASNALGSADAFSPLRDLFMRTFPYPEDDPRYRRNALMPMAPPFEPSFSETQPNTVRYTIEPLPPEAAPVDRRDEATREMRRLLGNFMGRDALNWFDGASEPYRGFGTNNGGLGFGAFFGSAYDRNGLYSSKVYYEAPGGQISIDNMPMALSRIVQTALALIPGLQPLFTTVAAQRDAGGQRLTFAATQPLRLADLQPTLDALGLGHRLSGIMQMIGLILGGRFDLPANSALLAFGDGPAGPDFEIYVLLNAIPDVPPSFLSLLTMGLSERPRGLAALERWMSAFTPEDEHWPGRFSIVSLRTDALTPPRVSLYLRPVEFELPAEALQRAA
ncbi:MAG TPA: hypothetical protein VHG29_10480 [Novosphingobium sp.]|nr:hypothetical protein [Novosphingobium sp.]